MNVLSDLKWSVRKVDWMQTQDREEVCDLRMEGAIAEHALLHSEPEHCSLDLVQMSIIQLSEGSAVEGV